LTGTFDAAVERLDELAELGVTAVEVMPIASVAGTRNWGYDGIAWFAPSATYGGPAGFKRVVDAAHRRGLGVILDVVYNHFGPEGNYLPLVTGNRIFNERHRTDDLHRQVRRLAAGDRDSYFRSYGGAVADVVATLRRGWYFEGQ
jgi:1,4-alpha-glucan branching enzyme